MRMLKKIISLILLGSIFTDAFGQGNEVAMSSNTKNCSKGMIKEEVSTTDLNEEFINSVADFSVDLFKEATKEDIKNGENVLLSPESVLCALSMTANGASGDTLTEMEDTMAGGMSISNFNRYMYSYNQKLLSSENASFNLANSLWIKDSDHLAVSNDFVQTCLNYYDSTVYKAPFDYTTKLDINRWVDYHTNHLIPQILDDISNTTVMYLINALAFESEWDEPYEESQINEYENFTTYDNNIQNVTMLNSVENCYVCDDNATGFIKKYKGEKFAFMTILPNDENGLYEYVSNMTGKSILDLYENRSYESVIVKMPEFLCKYNCELSECLKNLGIKTAFKSDADFSVIAKSTNALYIDQVLHKTFIQVDKNGTKASAVTAVEMVEGECVVDDMEFSKTVILDRPFIYAIVDTEVGLPVFLGVVNSVK